MSNSLLKRLLRYICAAAFMALLSLSSAAQGPQEKDYLTSLEADKIRDAETPNEKVKLFLTYAEDRLKKFQYELAHPGAGESSGNTERIDERVSELRG